MLWSLPLSSLLLAPLVAGAEMENFRYPRAVTNSTTLLPTATGLESHNCSWSWSSWISASNAFRWDHETTANLTQTYTYHNITASTTVGCDNITRIVGDLTTIATGTNVTVTSSWWNTANYTGPTPTCTPPTEECFDLYSEMPSGVCTRPTTSVPQICGKCAIYGGTVDLLYFPKTATTRHTICPTDTMKGTMCPLGPTTATNNATNPYENHPCYYTTANSTTQNSGPYIVSDAHTFYENRAYISLASVYATDRCGYVGEQHAGTIVEVMSKDIYSVGGYHHFFADSGYSFDFEDLKNPPSRAYYLNCDGGGGMACEPQRGTRYSPGTDFINGVNTVDLGRGSHYEASEFWIWPEAYAPIILMPTQIRNLDPAWSTCILDLGGLYDPPRALTQADAAEPTAPTPDGGSGTTAQPGNNPTTVGPSETAQPTTTYAPASPVVQPTDDGELDAPTPDPTAGGQDSDPTPPPSDGNEDDTDPEQGTDEENADDAADETPSAGGPADADQPTPTTQNAGGIIASLLGGEGDAAQPAGNQDGGAQPTGTIQNIGDMIASVLGMSQGHESPTSPPQADGQPTSSPQQGEDEPITVHDVPAAGPVIFTADSVTYSATQVPGSEGVYVVDGTQTVTADGSTLDIDGVTAVAAASAAPAVDGEQTSGSPASQSSATGSSNEGDDSASAASESSDAGPSAPAQTGNSGAQTAIPSHLIAAALAGGAIFQAAFR